MESYRPERDAENNEWVEVNLRGRELLRHPMYNRGTAFTMEERRALGLLGLLPAGVCSLAQQTARAYGYISRKEDPLEKFIGLEAIHARNSVLFHRVILDHIDEFLPIVYTPTVGQACQMYSRIYRRGRGLWITPEHKGHIREVLSSAPYDDVRLIVATDNERILGLGDQGAGGMGIPAGKLVLYTVAAGIHPTWTLPISLDVGTDNEELLADELYVGWRKPRLRGQAYDELIEEFVSAVQSCFPRALLQWEDFKKANAFRLLDRYASRICSFNDDIQGTAGVALAGVLAASRITGTRLRDQRFVIAGAGAAGIGIARLLRDAMLREGVAKDDVVRAIAVLDSRGLLVEGQPSSDTYKLEFAWPAELVRQAGLSADEPNDLLSCARALRPSVLIGTTGQPGSFTEPVVRAVAQAAERPVILPFSNPTSFSEARPADLIRWTNGRALVATGSPFDPVEHDGRTFLIGQGNNAYVFPGVGLGAIVSGARRITDGMFLAAAYALADEVSAARLETGALYPPLPELRRVSASIAAAVARAAFAADLAEPVEDSVLERRIAQTQWYPDYPQLRLPAP